MEINKFSYCQGCLCFSDDCYLQDYKITGEPLKAILQVDGIQLCYICKRLAQKTEAFLQNVRNNQIFLENLHNVAESVVQPVKSKLISLTQTTLDNIEITNDDIDPTPISVPSQSKVICVRSTQDSDVAKVKEVDIKLELELKPENAFLDHLEGEFVDDDDDFQDSAVKQEEDGFPLKDLLCKNKLENAHMRLKKSLKRTRADKKSKKHQRSKRAEKKGEYEKEDFPLSDLFKDELVEELQSEGLSIADLQKDQIKKPKQYGGKKDLYNTEVVYITREQCMEERSRLAQDKKYQSATYKCRDCVKTFIFQESYDKHMKHHSSAMGDYECDICKQRTSSKEKLIRHKKCHEVRYKCMECGLTRINRLTIQEHYNAFHLKVDSHLCPHCPKTFARQVSLRKHIAYCHKNRVRVKCQYCQKTYANKEVLKAHIIVRHPKEISAGESLKRYICQECGMAFKAPSQLRNHNIKHSHTRDYYCVECDKSFKTETAFKRHVKVTAPHVNYMELPLPCAHCDKRFAIRRDLERHTNRVHLNIRPFQCDKCDRAYVNNWSLNEHKRFVHEGEKRPLKYPCSMCDKVFDRNQTLKAHVRTHTGERPFQCARCPARFAQSSARGTHLRLVHLRLPRARLPAPL